MNLALHMIKPVYFMASISQMTILIRHGKQSNSKVVFYTLLFYIQVLFYNHDKWTQVFV